MMRWNETWMVPGGNLEDQYNNSVLPVFFNLCVNSLLVTISEPVLKQIVQDRQTCLVHFLHRLKLCDNPQNDIGVKTKEKKPIPGGCQL